MSEIDRETEQDKLGRDRDEAAKYLAMGVDTVLTNDYNRVSKAKG